MPDQSDSHLAFAPVSQTINPVRYQLRLENFAVLFLAVSFYAHEHASWLMFAVLFFAPDISMSGYLLGPRIGAAAYNLVHTYTAPATLAILMHLLGYSLALSAIWAGHIGFDRAMGYGLKYPTGFNHTHLGVIGKAATVKVQKTGTEHTEAQGTQR